jgi:hypothetical protein
MKVVCKSIAQNGIDLLYLAAPTGIEISQFCSKMLKGAMNGVE